MYFNIIIGDIYTGTKNIINVWNITTNTMVTDNKHMQKIIDYFSLLGSLYESYVFIC